MGITGTWKERRAVQAGPAKWGTGWNPIHAVPMDIGRGLAPESPLSTPPIELTEQYENTPDGYTQEDMTIVDTFGYGVQTGTSERVGMGVKEPRGSADGFPAWTDDGDIIRAENKGATATSLAKSIPDDPVAQGWLNKKSGEVNNPTPSDPSQYEIDTSMTQLHQVREGSQAQRGRSSDFLAPISSRITGMKLRFWPGGLRHAEMEPRRQTMVIRGFWNRSAGTGNPQWMTVNEMYQATPYQRTPPDNPNQGQVLSAAGSWQDEGWFY